MESPRRQDIHRAHRPGRYGKLMGACSARLRQAPPRFHRAEAIGPLIAGDDRDRLAGSQAGHRASAPPSPNRRCHHDDSSRRLIGIAGMLVALLGTALSAEASTLYTQEGLATRDARPVFPRRRRASHLRGPQSRHRALLGLQRRWPARRWLHHRSPHTGQCRSSAVTVSAGIFTPARCSWAARPAAGATIRAASSGTTRRPSAGPRSMSRASTPMPSRSAPEAPHLRAAGRARAVVLGQNANGQLGDGTTTDRRGPWP